MHPGGHHHKFVAQQKTPNHRPRNPSIRPTFQDPRARGGRSRRPRTESRSTAPLRLLLLLLLLLVFVLVFILLVQPSARRARAFRRPPSLSRRAPENAESSTSNFANSAHSSTAQVRAICRPRLPPPTVRETGFISTRPPRIGRPYDPISASRATASRSPGHSSNTARHWHLASSRSPRSIATTARFRRVRCP